MLPVYDGMTVLRRIRKQSDVPIIMLTAKNSASDISSALDQGLDDCLTKPFEIEELLARIRVVLRRLEKMRQQNDVPDTSLEFGPLKIDLLKHEFYCDNEKIYLTPKEFALITELMRDPEQVKVVMNYLIQSGDMTSLVKPTLSTSIFELFAIK